ncbi:MAG TPA: hypothetical protein VF099_02460, partial [Ktedonobacterales bacterium]
DLDHISIGAIYIYLFPLSIYLLSILALLFAAIAVSAVLHSRTGAARWQACLWACTVLLAGVLLLTLGNLIMALWPALLLALVASSAAWVAARQRARERHQRGSVARQVEILGGVAASLLGLAASAYLLTAPNQSMSGNTSCNAQGVCQEIITGSPSPLLADPLGTLLTAILPLAFFGLLAFSFVRHSQTGASIWRAWMWGMSLLLVAFSILGMLSIGLFFVPSALLALLAAICSSFGPTHAVEPARRGV